MLCVEAAMRAYAKKYGEDEEMWGICGLLHDFDYEKYPTQEGHPIEGSKILKEKGYPEEITHAILGHALYLNVPRDTNMSKCLFAVDELCGLVMATAYLRPDHLESMTVESVEKNFKKKGFASRVSREDIDMGINELGADRAEHIKLVIDAMRGIAKELGF